jgi:hypothetical protein
VNIILWDIPQPYAVEAFELLIDSFESGQYEPSDTDTLTDATERYMNAKLVCALGKVLGRGDEIHSGIVRHTKPPGMSTVEVPA